MKTWLPGKFCINFSHFKSASTLIPVHKTKQLFIQHWVIISRNSSNIPDRRDAIYRVWIVSSI
ncbi:MAG: hypothetical protein WCP01_12355, partial [Methylococcaceae bacterium]